MPLQATSGAASYDAFGGGVAAVPNFIEDVFSTFLYSGNNGSPNTITNGIDLAEKGGLVWIKSRSGAYNHGLIDTVRGRTKELHSNSTAAQDTCSGTTNGLTSFNSNGFTLGNDEYTIMNSGGSTFTYASWTFRKQPKFFDVVTYTGTGSARTVAHNLGSVPGCIIVKRTNTTSNWRVYHRSLTSAAYMVELNTSAGQAVENGAWNSTAPTSSVFTVGSASEVNASGSTYVAYVFAHDSAGFGLLGTDNVISCGSFTTNGSGVASVNLGYEPQWVVAKAVAGGTGSWVMQDNMRGFTASPTVYTANPLLFANTADSEATFGASTLQANSTGFTTDSATYDPSVTYIYIAIRRGPMKVPTSGTSVFAPIARTGTASDVTVSGVGFPPDLVIPQARTSNYQAGTFFDRLRGNLQALFSNATTAETTISQAVKTLTMDGFTAGVDNSYEAANAARTYINWFFRRAPSFFDVVCYTGTGVAGRTVAHNLTVAPELIIVKSRSLSGEQWPVYASPITVLKVLQLNTTIAATTYSDYWNNTAPTSSVFSVGDTSTVNKNGATFVAYLFATCAGVSKVGSYTGNGSSQTINCGFTGGARFVMVKATSTTGDWMVADSARGIVAGSDPYLELNNTNAEVTGEDWLDTDSTGFVVNEVSGSNANTSGATYIFLAIA